MYTANQYMIMEVRRARSRCLLVAGTVFEHAAKESFARKEHRPSEDSRGLDLQKINTSRAPTILVATILLMQTTITRPRNPKTLPQCLRFEDLIVAAARKSLLANVGPIGLFDLGSH
jgi:hypothetical protein